MIGEVVSHYRILKQLGAGGMGVVYKAEDTRLGRPVAVKFLPEEWSNDVQALERFRLEARAASALNHPQICTIYDIGEYRRRPFIVMEYLEGETLKEHIRGRPLRLEEILDIGTQISSALEAAHTKGIIHRDIKPGNIFLNPQYQAKLLDFGLAKLAPRNVTGTDVSTTAGNDLTSAGAAVGTAAYMSPEQARAEEIDERTDLFSLGVVLYEMATGTQAFAGSSAALVYDAILNRDPVPASQRNPALPPVLSSIISKALEKDRRFRYQHAADMRTDLERLRRDVHSERSASASHAEPERPGQYRARPRRTNRAFWLGLIPGVGALYNGEYQKAAIHVVVFVVISTLKDIVPAFLHGSFSLLQIVFVAYMAFDARNTAEKQNRE